MGNNHQSSPKSPSKPSSQISTESKKQGPATPQRWINGMQKRINEIISHRLQPRVVENFIIMWLDSSIKPSNGDTRYSINKLKAFVNEVQTFTDPARCVDCIATIHDERIFLITSGSMCEEVLPLIGEHPQIESIYIFCMDKPRYKPIARQYHKVKGVFKDIETICKLIGSNVRQGEQDLIPISTTPNHSVVNTSELDRSFLYSQLLKEVLLDLEYSDQAKRELVSFCRQQYNGNEHELGILDDFEKRYEQHSPIWWYTRECFTYSMLNKALRTHDIEVIMRMGYFMRDLHWQIRDLHAEANLQEPLVTYRGQGISEDELSKIKRSQDGLLSFNNFLSTSVDRDIALKYAHRTRDKLNSFAILFRMEIDPSVSSAPYASVEHVSFYANEEREILFSMHTIFRITSVEEIEERLWQVDLTLTSDQDKQLEALAKSIQHEMRGGKGLHRMGALMLEMGRIDKAEEIFSVLREKTAEDDLEALAELHHQLGDIYSTLSRKTS